MEEKNVSLQEEQACESAPKIGSVLFALFYTFCLYRNESGITYPFFVAGSLLYLFYYIKKCGSTAGKENYCIAGSMMFLGAIQSTTDSAVVIWTNRYMIWGLSLVILIRSLWQEQIVKWEIFGWMKNVLQIAFGSIIKGFWLFPDTWECIKTRKMAVRDEKLVEKRRVTRAVLLGVLAVIPIMIVILTLLSSADALFRNIFVCIFRFVEEWNMPDFLMNVKFWQCLFMMGSSCLAVYGLGKSFLDTEDDKTDEIGAWEEKKKPDPITGLIIVGAVGAVYLLFCFIQIFGLFLGKMSLPEGYTYARYAREGFFQLAALCAMNIFFVMVIAKQFDLSRLMKCFLMVVSGCTYIMIASSAYKMIMYVKVYQLSFLRLTVLWALFVMAVLMSGVVYRILTERDRLVRFFFIVLLVSYCIFVAARPDYQIAGYNLARQEASEQTKDRQKADFRYLYYGLSADAVPVWIEYTEKSDSEEHILRATLESLQKEKDEMTFRTFNFSRYYAGMLAEKKLEEMYGAAWREETDKAEEQENSNGTDLINMTMEQGNGYAAVIWDDKIFVPYCVISIEEQGAQIGIIDGESDNKVYEYKNYPSDEWIINAFDHDGAMLWREVTVTDIPEELTSEDYIKIEQAGFPAIEPEEQTASIQPYEIPETWLSIRPDATWELKDGSKWEMVAVDAACGSKFYVLLGEDSLGKKSLINDDPFHGEGGGSVWMSVVGEIGFASLVHNGGAEGSLYRTDDMGHHFSRVEIPPVMEQLSSGEYFTPYDTPAEVWTEGDTFFLLMEQGEDGDFYKDGKKASAVYVSTDQGETWYYGNMVGEKNQR